MKGIVSAFHRLRRNVQRMSLSRKSWSLLLLVVGALIVTGSSLAGANVQNAREEAWLAARAHAARQADSVATLMNGYRDVLALSAAIRQPGAACSGNLHDPGRPVKILELSPSGVDVCGDGKTTAYRGQPWLWRHYTEPTLITEVASDNLAGLLVISNDGHQLVMPLTAAALSGGTVNYSGNVDGSSTLVTSPGALKGQKADWLSSGGEVRHAAVAVPGTPWFVTTQMSGQHALQQAGEATRGLVIVVSVAILFGIALVILFHVFLVGPLRKLRRAIREVAPVAGPAAQHMPREISDVFTAFHTVVGQRDEARLQLANALVDLLDVRSSERTQLADAIHDGPVQDLVLAQWNLEKLPNSQSRTRDATLQHLENAESGLREQSFYLRSGELDTDGLAPALRRQADLLLHPRGIETHFSLFAELPITDRLANLTFRTAREALLNVAKHSRAHEVWLSLSITEEYLACSIRDDGVGIEPGVLTAKRRQGHIGVISMRESLNAAGGHFRIKDLPRGTQVEFSIPRTDPATVQEQPEGSGGADGDELPMIVFKTPGEKNTPAE